MMKDTVNLPIAIPAWSLVTLLAGAVFTAGTLHNQMATLIESNKKNDERVSLIHERQIANTATINNQGQLLQNHEARITNVERALLQGAKAPSK